VRYGKKNEKIWPFRKIFHSNACFFQILFLSLATKQFIQLMTNKRVLKRTINCACGDLFAECVAAACFTQKHDLADVDALLTCIIRINNDFVRRISHPEPGIRPRVFYNQLIADFSKQALELEDQIRSIC
jgi:hypothetical protein